MTEHFTPQLNRVSVKGKPTNTHVEEILENNNLRRISIPNEGRNNLFKSLSFALFFSLNEEVSVQQHLISHLKTLIQEKNLPLKLAMFENDLMLFKDYCSNPHFHGFDKISLELTCHAFEVRVVVYSISDENYLNSTIYNNRYDNTITLLKLGTHFDVVVDDQKFDLMSFSQNLVYEFLFGVLGIYSVTNKPFFVSALGSPYDIPELIIENYENVSNQLENKLKPKHKKSLSDNFNISNDKSEEKNAYYNLFLNLQAPKEFLTNITPSNSRFARNFNSESTKNQAAFLFPNERQKNELTKESFQYGQREHSVRELEKSPLSNQYLQPSKPPMFYVGSTPPGLTPKKVQDVPFKANEEEYQNNPHFQISDSGKHILGNNSQLFDNFLYKSLPKSNYFPYSSSTFPEQENKNTFNVNKEDNTNTFKASAGLANIPQKPDLNKSIQNPNFFYTNYMPNSPIQNEESKKQIIFDPSTSQNTKKTGRVKFFDEAKNYGFIIMDEDGSDIFVHFDDLAKAGVGKELLRTAKQGNIIRFSFNCMNYIGKYNKSKKAVDLTLLNSFI